MSCLRHLLCSFILAAALSPLVNAVPNKPEETSTSTEVQEVLTSSSTASTDITTSATDTEEADLTTTTITTVTVQDTQPSETVKPVCVDNKWSPPPKGAFCDVEGRTQTIHGHMLGRGSYESLLRCREDCQKRVGCILFSFKLDERCDFWSRYKVLTDEKFNGHKWWEPRCFCNVPDYEPEPE